MFNETGFFFKVLLIFLIQKNKKKRKKVKPCDFTKYAANKPTWI
jgi:hypothetical protein